MSFDAIGHHFPSGRGAGGINLYADFYRCNNEMNFADVKKIRLIFFDPGIIIKLNLQW
jgi:hypothetical protein